MNLSKNLLRRILLIVAFIGLIFSLWFLLRFFFKSKVENILVPLTTNTAFYEKEELNYKLPVRIKIQRINVDAAVQYVGITSLGSMGVPEGPDDVAWFNLGPRPGENGSAVIAGHSGWKDGIPAVFDNLYKLRKGDEIYIEDKKGNTTTFVVHELKTYGLNEDASDVFISNDEKAHLNLVTCTGDWNKINKSHSDRLVVFADKK